MIGRIYAVALNTFREAVRRRVLYGIVAVVFGFNLFALVLGELSLHEHERVARDVGLSGISVFGSITAIILGVVLLYGEIQKRTLHVVISKPIGRFEFVAGKYAGMVMTLTVLVALFAAAMAALLALKGIPITSAVVKAVVLAYFEVLVVAAVAVFFSAFSTPFLSGIFAFAVFFLGRATPEMRAAVESADQGWIRTVCEGALYLLPDLNVFAISGGQVDGQHVTVHSDFVSWGYVGTAAGFATLYIVVLLSLSMVIFSRRDFV